MFASGEVNPLVATRRQGYTVSVTTQRTPDRPAGRRIGDQIPISHHRYAIHQNGLYTHRRVVVALSGADLANVLDTEQDNVRAPSLLKAASQLHLAKSRFCAPAVNARPVWARIVGVMAFTACSFRYFTVFL